MFPLQRESFPQDSETLRVALEESLRAVVRPAGQMVKVEDAGYPKLAALRISLDGAQTGDRPPPRPQPVGPVSPALEVQDFEISANPLLVQRARVQLACSARDLRLGQGSDRDRNVLLLLQDAADGNIEVAVALTDLEALVLAGAKAEAAKQGVTVEEVRIELRARSEHALDVTVHVRARKLFLTAAVRISGSAAIDEQLTAHLSGLECAGDGTLGTLACGFIAPQLERYNGREFSLMALPLGDVKLRDVRIATGKELRITAAFGRA
jgi:hypothetical protein